MPEPHRLGVERNGAGYRGRAVGRGYVPADLLAGTAPATHLECKNEPLGELFAGLEVTQKVRLAARFCTPNEAILYKFSLFFWAGIKF